MLTVSGRVTSIAWRDEYTGETRACIVPEDFNERKRRDQAVYHISGHCAFPIVPGEVVRVTGNWQTDRLGQRFFAWTGVSRVPPATREGEVIALASYIQGLSKAGATELLERSGGLDALRDVCTNRPETLDGLLPGTGKRVRALRQRLRNFQWDRTELDPDLTAALHSVGKGEMERGGIRTDQIHRMIRHFGAGPLKTILQNRPYEIADVDKVGFSTADKVAFYYAGRQGRPFDPLDHERLRLGVLDVLGRERGSGHVCMPEDHLVQRAMATLRAPDGSRLPRGPVTETRLREAISANIEDRRMALDYEHLYTLGLNSAEKEFSLQIAKLLRSGAESSRSDLRRIRKYLEAAEEETGLRLNEEQTAAVEMALTHPVSIVTGGPGVGKTLTSARIVGAIKALHRTFRILAPTGKAAKRAADVTGEEASTIHRACQLDMSEDVHSRRFGRTLTRFDYFREDYILVDEASMIDLGLGFELARRIKPGRTKVIFIGDIDQLPPVGPGQVFRDLLESGVVPLQRLTEVFRQKGGAGVSPIVTAAYAINSGQVPEVPEESHEVRVLDPRSSRDFVAGPDEDANQELEGQITTKWLLYSLKKYTDDLDLDPVRDIQVYAPERKGPVGIDRLNLVLRDYFNPLPPGFDRGRGRCIKIRGGYVVQRGCKVMQAQNDYRLRYAEGVPDAAYEEFRERAAQQRKEKARRSRGAGARQAQADNDVIPVMNGQIGYVTRVDPDRGELEVQFEDLEYPVLYKHSAEWHKLVPAWAMSIHKSQGSETPYAFIVLHSGMYMLNRPLLYTGWTRAKKGVLLIATPDVLAKTVSSVRGTERYTNLPQRLREDVKA